MINSNRDIMEDDVDTGGTDDGNADDGNDDNDDGYNSADDDNTTGHVYKGNGNER